MSYVERYSGLAHSCCGKVGRISRHESWCPTLRKPDEEIASACPGCGTTVVHRADREPWCIGCRAPE